MDVKKFSIPEILFGRGSIQYAALSARRLGAEKIFFVSDPGVEAAGWVDQIFDILASEKPIWPLSEARPSIWSMNRRSALTEGLSKTCDKELHMPAIGRPLMTRPQLFMFAAAQAMFSIIPFRVFKASV
jgi:hypothetical protein